MMKSQSYSKTTSLTIPQIREVVRNTFRNATIENIAVTGIDEPADIAVYIDAKPSFLGGRGLVDLRVRERGNHRDVVLTALGTTFSDNVAMSFAKDMSGLRELGTGKRMAQSLLKAM